MQIKRMLTAAMTVMTIGALAACGDSTNADTGRISLKLTDAPGDFQKAVVTIDQIYLQGGSDENPSGGRVVLLSTPVTIDLLTLANSVQDLVTDAVVPAGTYSQLRFVVSGAYIQVDNGNGTSSVYATPGYAGVPAGTTVTGNLQAPSFSTSGLKVQLPGGSVHIGGDARILLVDFNVAESFGHDAGGQWVMHPVVKATEFVTSGTLNATLAKADTVTVPTINGAATALSGFKAVLTTADGTHEEQALVDGNADGVYEASFKFLVPGTYTLDFVAPSDSIVFTTNPTHPATLSVGSGAVTAQAFTITSAHK